MHMFDFSFGELAVIGAVALVVLGPEKLPRVARTAGQLLGKAQRYVNDVKADIQREAELADLKKLQQQVQESAREIETSIQQNITSIGSDFREAAAAVTSDASAVESGTRADAGGATWHDFVKPPPSNEELAAELDALKRSLHGASVRFAVAPRFKYAPRARVARPLPARLARPRR